VVSRTGSRLPRWWARLLAPLILVVLVAAAFALWRLRSVDYFWHDPLKSARFHRITQFEGSEHSAAISRDGRLVAFLSSHDGPVDVFVTQYGSGTFHNVTRGHAPEQLINREIRTLGFSPDGARVEFWVGKSDVLDPSKQPKISIWSVPTLGGEPRLDREDVAELDWSPDGRRLVFHRPPAGDPMFVESEGEARQIYFAGTPEAPKHAHFPTWSPDGSFIYFVQGEVPDGPQDIWRIRPTGGAPERLTFHGSRVSYPTFLDRSTLLYLATGTDGSGPWIYGLDVARGVPHRLSHGVERYTSLDASSDGSRVVVTSATQFRTSLWRVPLSTRVAVESDVAKIALPTAQGRSPTLASDFLLYVSSDGEADRIWKLLDGAPTELWTDPGARIVGGPAVSRVDSRIAFSVQDRGKARLVVMNADGTGLRTVVNGLDLRGAPTWSPDGKSIVTAVDQPGGPRLFRISVPTGEAVRVTDDYALGPAWAPQGDFLVYSGKDPGTQFPVRAVTPDGRGREIPGFSLSRGGAFGVRPTGSRRLRFMPEQATLVVLRGDIEHKNLWAVDLTTGSWRQLTDFPRGILIGDFDVSPDGREIVFERVEENSDIWLIDRGAD
jgi:Tol biopolymer transport system component